MPLFCSLILILGAFGAPKSLGDCGYTWSAERCSRLEDLSSEQFLQRVFPAEVQKLTNHTPVQRLLRWILPQGGGFSVDLIRGELISSVVKKSFWEDGHWSLNNRESASPKDSRWMRYDRHQSILERMEFRSKSEEDFILARQTSWGQVSTFTWLHAGKSGVKSVIFCPSAPHDCFILSPRVCSSFVDDLEKGQFYHKSIQDRLKAFREDWFLEMQYFEKLHKEESQNLGRTSLISDLALFTQGVDRRLQHPVGRASAMQLMDICLYMSW